MDDYALCGIIIILITIINALVHAAEAAILSVNESDIKKLAEEGNKKASRLLKMLGEQERYENVLETIFTTFSLVTGFLFSGSVYGKLREVLFSKGVFLEKKWLSIGMTIVITVVIFMLIIMLGNVFPKRLGKRHAEKAALRYTGLMLFLAKLLFPVCFIIEKCTNGLLRLFRLNPDEVNENVTEDEIISMVTEGHEQGVLEAEEVEMISNIIEFDEKEAKDIMTHRKKLVAIDSETTVNDALDFILEDGHSRYPVYKDDIDNIVGVLHLKDVIKYRIDHEQNDTDTVMKVVKEPFFVPDTQNIDVLFRDMQRKKVHMAIAIDEYGQTAGIVAMEDILEEIVGEIQDEFDNEEEPIVRTGNDTFIVRGDANLEELCEETGLSIDDEELENFETVNGFLISLLDRIPKDGETPVLDYPGARFEVLSTKNKMFLSAKLTVFAKQKDEISSEEEE